MIVLQTNHFVNIQVTEAFAAGTNSLLVKINEYNFDSQDTLASYGILRGVGSLLRKSKKFIYLDHGYIGASDRSFTKALMYFSLNIFISFIFFYLFHMISLRFAN